MVCSMFEQSCFRLHKTAGSRSALRKTAGSGSAKNYCGFTALILRCAETQSFVKYWEAILQYYNVAKNFTWSNFLSKPNLTPWRFNLTKVFNTPDLRFWRNPKVSKVRRILHSLTWRIMGNLSLPFGCLFQRFRTFEGTKPRFFYCVFLP